MQKSLKMRIVKNALEPNKDYNLKTKALLCWEDAEFSDGEKATAEIIEELANSVDFSSFKPPLLIDHDWDAEKIMGLMSSIKNEDSNLIAEFDVMKEEAGRNIESGLWRNISLTFERDENGKVRILECSIVAIPQIAGAKIEPVENGDPEVTKTEGEDVEKTETDKTEEIAEVTKTEGEDTEKTEVEKIEEKEEEKTENACDDDKKEMAKIIANAKTLAKENAVLNAKIRRLETAAKIREKEIVVNGYLNNWLNSGKTSPAVSAVEKALLMSMSEEQIERYIIVKNDAKGAIFGRLSAPVDNEDKETAQKARAEAKYNKHYGGSENGN